MSYKRTYLKSVENGYTKVANRIFRIGLSAMAIALAVYIISNKDKDENGEAFHPSQSLMARTLGIKDTKTINKLLRELERKTVITVYQYGRGKKYRYEVRPIQDWGKASLPTTGKYPVEEQDYIPTIQEENNNKEYTDKNSLSSIGERTLGGGGESIKPFREVAQHQHSPKAKAQVDKTTEDCIKDMGFVLPDQKGEEA